MAADLSPSEKISARLSRVGPIRQRQDYGGGERPTEKEGNPPGSQNIAERYAEEIDQLYG